MSINQRPSVIQLAIKDKAALYAAYIPLFAAGGIFVPSLRDHVLGDEVYLLLSLPGEVERYPISGKVVWLTPAKASHSRKQGIGVQFPEGPKSLALRQKIEEILGAYLASDRSTQTI